MARMAKNNDVEAIRLFACAERKRTCLVPASPRVREVLRRHINQGRVVRPARGMYARSSYWNALPKRQRTLHVARTLQELHPQWTFCHETAAAAFDLPIPFDGMDVIHVATSRAKRNSSSGIVRWHVVNGDTPVIAEGLRVTSLARTAFDCMRTADFKQALAVADGTLRFSGERPSTFVTRFKRIGSTHVGTSRAIRTMWYANALSESGGESIARATMIEHGFALPLLQVALPRPLDQSRTYRVDFLWTRVDGSKVIGEFDGMQKYEDAAMRGGRSALRVLADEQHRESQLTLFGMPIVRFSYRDIMDGNAFANLLRQYGIPQSNEIARAERRLARSKSTSAQLFTVDSLVG